MQLNHHNPHSPSFLAENQTIASLISQMHQYFKDAAAYGKVDRSNLMSHLEAADPQREQEVLQQIQKLDTEIALFRILEDSLSIADRVIHSQTAFTQIGLTDQIYQALSNSSSQQKV